MKGESANWTNPFSFAKPRPRSQQGGWKRQKCDWEKSPVSMVIDGDPMRRRRRPAHPVPACALGLFPRLRPRSISLARPPFYPRCFHRYPAPARAGILGFPHPGPLFPPPLPQSIPNPHESASAIFVKFQAWQVRARQGCSGRRWCPSRFDRWCSRRPCGRIQSSCNLSTTSKSSCLVHKSISDGLNRRMVACAVPA
ncbi:hypothetical protein SORBI_3002G188400 [Sorghum bicolor]|uniref:Uncharacterized protein n=2 Tax=Sorghum bicolor TaxID=4558 RepID=A0A1B6QC87_SORBI|nr:hypothetical protein SORBI_3002G188400 [Sorghum bicolor]